MPTDKTRRFLLRLKSLNFISLVDNPAQEPALVALIKRHDRAAEVSATARIVKTDDELGLVFGWAMTSRVDDEPYFDLHGDALTEQEMVECAADFMAGARTSDVQHDEREHGQVVFAMPMTKEIAGAFGVETSTSGLMIAVKPSPEVLARIKSGELRGFSIGGTGIREEVAAGKRADAALKAAALTAAVDGHQHLIDLDRQAGETSYAQTLAGVGHCHPYTIADGVVTIGMAADHTHEASAGSKPADPAEAAEKRRTSVDVEHEANLRKAGELRAWFAALPFDRKTEVAKLNKEASWLDGFLESEEFKAHEAEQIAKAAAAAEDVEVEKALEQVEKTIEREEAALNARITAIAKRDKITKGAATIVAFERDDETRAIYDRLHKAREDARPGALRAARWRQEAQAKIDKARAEMDQMVESFALQHNLERAAASVRLMKVSRRYEELRSQVSEAQHEAQTAERRARAIDEELIAARAEKRRREEAERVAKESAAAQSPSERALYARFEEIAKERNCAHGPAVAWALEHDELARTLYDAVHAERRTRRRGA